MAEVRVDSRHEVVKEAVRSGLIGFNNRYLPADRDVRPISLSVRDGDRIVGGLCASASVNWVFIDLLWVDDAYRGHGYGAELLTQLEEQALSLGLKHVYLDTFGFQAAGFYEKLGYREFGRLDDFLAGYDRIWMRKDL